MGQYEKQGGSVEYYTPKYIFDALGVEFDLDVAHPNQKTNVPAKRFITENSLSEQWEGFIWMNPPYLSEKNKEQWLKKFFDHGNGLALMPDRSNAKWHQIAEERCDLYLHTKDKIKFLREDGTIADSPGNNSTIFAIGHRAVSALLNAHENELGFLHKRFVP